MLFRHIRFALFWALFIAVLCGIPGQDIPHISFLELLSFDKFVHAGIFFIFFILLAKGLKTQTQYPKGQKIFLIGTLIISVAYGGLLEILQDYVFEERSADVYDFIANSFGSVMGWVFFEKMDKKMLNRYFSS